MAKITMEWEVPEDMEDFNIRLKAVEMYSLLSRVDRDLKYMLKDDHTRESIDEILGAIRNEIGNVLYE